MSDGTRHRGVAAALAGILCLLAVLSLCRGDTWTPLDAWWGEDAALRAILYDLRAPRVVLAAAVGAALGLAGAAMQGYARNPLADPGLLGVSSGGALGAVVIFYGGFASAFSLALPVGGLAGSLAAIVLLGALAGPGAPVQTLLLAGVAVNALGGALTALALNLSPNPFATLELSLWLLGSVADRSWPHVHLALPFIAAGSILLLTLGPAFRSLSLGEETAASLGHDLPSLRRRLLAGVALAVGSSVAVAGSIGFVGLVVPHLLRPAVRHDPARLLPLSALGGAALLVATDLAVRLIPTGTELKLGVVTSLVGAPFFLALLVGQRRTGSP